MTQKDRNRYYHERNANRRKIAIKELGNECRICGCTTYECLQLHHLFKWQHLKRIALTASAFGRNSLHNIIEELKLCVVLCSNCHIKVHAGIRKEPKQRKNRSFEELEEKWNNVYGN